MSLSTQWTLAAPEESFSNAVVAGTEVDGKKVYVGRVADASGNYLPAKVIPDFNKSYYDQDGTEESTEQIEYLTNAGEYDWVKSSSGAIVPDAVTLGGFYVGRGVWNGNMVVGRVDLNTKQLVATFGGNALTLSDYDVLISKPQDSSRLVNGITNTSSFVISEKQTVNNSVSVLKVQQDKTVVREPLFNQQRYFEMLNRIQTLELELDSYKHDREAYENRIDFEQKRVEDLSRKLQALRLENSTLVKERTTFEERISTETTIVTEMESKLQNVLLDNSFLLKKVTALEDALKYERQQIALFNEKFQREQSAGGSWQIKIKNFEDTIRKLQQRILELESTIENTNSNSDSLAQQVKTYEITIQNMKMQIDTIIKKLQAANADNDFLVKKLALLTQNLKNYQFQLEAMSKRLQNSRAIIANAHSELARANAQIAKYQAALSSCYVLNGELMTKVSGFNAIAQFQGTFDSKFDILNMNTDFSVAPAKTAVTSTSSLLEATGSETFVSFVKITQENGTDSEAGSQAATPY